MIELIKGDITKLKVDAIVNAANSSLMGGGGVDGAIHRAGGHEIIDECRKIIQKIGSCKTGQAVITGAGKLPAKYVIHTVGPVWQFDKSGQEMLLLNCYKNSLELALSYGLKSVAFPNISTGVYAYPKADAAVIAIEAVKEFLNNNMDFKIIFVCFDEENLEIYKSLLDTQLNE